MGEKRIMNGSTTTGGEGRGAEGPDRPGLAAYGWGRAGKGGEVAGRRRGSTLVISLLLMVTLSIVLAGYLDMAITQLKAANFNYYKESAQQQVENGLEIGVWAMNSAGFDDSTYGDWELDEDDNTATLVIEKSLGNNRTSWTTVVVENYLKTPGEDGLSGGVTAETVVKDGDGNLVFRKRVTLDLEPRSFFPHGLTARDYTYSYYGTIKFRTFTPDQDYGDMDGSAYDYTYHDSGSLGAKTLYQYQGSYDIYGLLATLNGTDSLGTAGKLQNDETENPQQNPIDNSLYHNGFRTNFPDLEEPDDIDNYTYPTSTKVQLGAVQDSYYDAAEDRYSYRINGALNIPSGRTLEIYNDVVLVVEDQLYLRGSIVVKEGASLTLYLGDDMRGSTTATYMDGQIINESKDPSKLMVISTNPNDNTPDFYWDMPNELHWTLYAPRADVRYYGKEYGNNGKMYGAMVVNRLLSYGSLDVFYDRNAFANLVDDNRALDHHLTFNPVTWTEETPDDYLAGDPSP